MKKRIAIILSIVMVLSIAGCGDSAKTDENIQKDITSEVTSEVSEVAESDSETADADVMVTESQEAETADDVIEDEEWDNLEALGKVETENGLFFVTIHIPAELADENITQEELDNNARDEYLSATLNEDGSITYKLTKKQHKEALSRMNSGIAAVIDEMVTSDEYSFTDVKYNDDFTQFDCTLSTKELGINETLGALIFYMYGGYYGIYKGETPEHIVVNFYDPDGNLIESADSADME